jgi:hypothetical protein
LKSAGAEPDPYTWSRTARNETVARLSPASHLTAMVGV